MAVHRLGTTPPLIQLGVGIGGAHARRQRASQAMTATALLDTGATISAARPSVIERLKPIQIGDVEVTRADSTLECLPTYALRITFEPDTGPEQWWLRGHWFTLEVVRASPANPGVDLLIGRDLLNQVVFTWDGPKERFVLSY